MRSQCDIKAIYADFILKCTEKTASTKNNISCPKKNIFKIEKGPKLWI